MAGKAASSNPLVITDKSSDALNVQLHPLVLLTISDYITRHTLRQQEGPVVGAIIGQQNGRNFTLEHAYECKVIDGKNGVQLDGDWFSERLDMYREVHKVPALDLVAMFMLGPVEGPQTEHLPILQQVRSMTGAEGTMLLLFHPDTVENLQGGKLPISLYESQEEMEGEQAQMRFRELTFEVETGDAEMIGVNSVAVGGGTATAVPKAESTIESGPAAAPNSKEKKGKGKGKAKDEDTENSASTANVLSAEDDELITTLNSKVNAIKMLNERLNLLRTYLQTLPESYLTDASTTTAPPDTTNFQLLRSINSMLSRLPLLAPPTSAQSANDETAVPTTNLHSAAEKEKQDVHLTSLLASLTRSVAEAQNLGAKFHVMQREKLSKERVPFNRPGRMGMGDEGILADNGEF